MKSKTPYGLPPFQLSESWGKKAKVSHLTVGKDDDKRLVGIKVETDNGKFTIPVLDVRVSSTERKRVEQMERAVITQRGSKFFNPSYSLTGHSYNISKKHL